MSLIFTSKINWAQYIALAASILVYLGIDLDMETQVQLLAAINGVTAVVTWVFRTFFTTRPSGGA
jgi:hypothetical protein